MEGVLRPTTRDINHNEGTSKRAPKMKTKGGAFKMDRVVNGKVYRTVPLSGVRNEIAILMGMTEMGQWFGGQGWKRESDTTSRMCSLQPAKSLLPLEIVIVLPSAIQSVSNEPKATTQVSAIPTSKE
ncbi:hypothetical protein PROFUN_10564 [Planoprotostelium fungivorum]|uniref:Uncharacterized protein n=1 Tax=Planoprotostelium fungivorum TaxID=1890364 RepID=A0A2P6N6T4_9EUKA|nr:hypothetical protein PROFUN_10564 [Planoprotostelium fungivorum]